MGDAANMNDLNRFMRSPEGQNSLQEIRDLLKGRTIIDVSFSNEVHQVEAAMHLDNGQMIEVSELVLDVDVIREEFADVLQREYLVDYPERKPT